MKKLFQKKSIIALIIIVILVITYLIASPFITFNQIKFAVVNGNSEKLATYVDFPILRDNLKSQLKQDIQPSDNVFENLGNILATGMIDNIIDTVVTPDGIVNFVKKNKAQDATNSSAMMAVPDGIMLTKDNVKYSSAAWHYKFVNFNKFSITNKNDTEIELILVRNGLGWKLNNIILPKNILE